MKDISKKLLCFLSTVFFVLATQMPISALAATIKIAKPDQLDELMNLRVTRVFVDGVIDENTPRQLENALKGLVTAHSVYLNSPGGSLFAGLETGRVLRKYSSPTYIGVYRFNERRKNKPRVYDIEPGSCESACAFAFLGGYYRFMYSENSKFGVHRFWDIGGPKSNDLDRGQIITTAIVNYITEMGIDPGLMSYVASADKQSMNYIDHRTLKKLIVTNNGRSTPTWSIEHRDKRTILIGTQDIMTGGGKVAFICDNNRLVMIIRILVGARSAKMIASEKYVPRFLTLKNNGLAPDTTLKINPIEFIVDDDDSIVTTFILTYPLERHLIDLYAIGIGFTPPGNPDVFIGTVFDIGNESNRTRIRDFIASCN